MTEAKNKNRTEQRSPEINDPELQAIAAEFPEFAGIVAGADFGAADFMVENEDPNMRYYWAAKEAGRADGVERVKQLGYRASEKKHNHPDGILMETPQALYDYRMKKQQEQVDRKIGVVKRKVSEPEGGLVSLTTTGETPRLQTR